MSAETAAQREAVAEEGLAQWHRLHPLSPVVRAGRALVILFVVAVPQLLERNGDVANLVVDAVVAAVLALTGVISWLVTRWRVDGTDLCIETGLLRRSSQRYPLRQVQAIDVVQSGVARVLGLAELRLRTASSSGKGRLSCLRADDARRLRAQLLSLPAMTAAPTTANDPPADAAPDQPPLDVGTRVLQVDTGQLLASLVLSIGGVLALAYLVALVVTAAVSTAAAGGLVGGGFAVVLALSTGLWRRFNAGYHLTLETSGSGLHLQSGLVQTATEVLPPGRVQALRVVEPLLWRPFGWCRVEAGVAGTRARGDDRGDASRRRALLPVGSYAQAYQVLALVLPDLEIAQTPPPGRARWKAPLSYHRLAAGGNADCVLTRSGRLRRVSHWVPLEKVQSIRRTQGPVQRRLRLATVHLDTAGPRLHAALRDRDTVEADGWVDRLPALCAAARGRAGAVSRAAAAPGGPRPR